MGVLQTSKNLEILVTESKNEQERGKHKGKEIINTNSNPKENHRYSDGASRSNKKKKFEKTKCPYYMRGFHPKSQCMKNTIDQLKKLLEQKKFPFHKVHSCLKQERILKNMRGGML